MFFRPVFQRCIKVILYCGAKLLNEVRQPLSDFVDLYCRSVAESQITDSVDFLPTVTAAVVTNVMNAIQQVYMSTSTALCCSLFLFWICRLIVLCVAFS